jgi:hypothetical protein
VTRRSIYPSLARTSLLVTILLLSTAYASSSTVTVKALAQYPAGFDDPAGTASAVAETAALPSLSALGGSSALGARGTIVGSVGNQGPATTTTATTGLWAADWGGAAAGRSAAGWQAAARNDQILIGSRGVYRKWIPQLHTWNPSLSVLMYDLGPYLQIGSADYKQILAQHPDWFARDSSGRLINLPMFPRNYLMDPGNSAYRAWHAQQLAAAVAADGFDGAMVDSVGDGPLGNYASGVPIDPATHQPYAMTTWLQSEVLMLNGDKAAMPGKYLAFNGLVSGVDYFRDSYILATSNADAGIAELFLRQPTSPVTSFPAASEVQLDVEMIGNLWFRHKAFLGWTKMWSGGTAAQIAKWEQFTLGVYLLARNSASYLDFMPSHSADNTAVPYPNLQMQLGAPFGTPVMQGSTYSRQFQFGTVAVDLVTDTVTL